MKRFLVALIFAVFLAGPAWAGSMLSYTLNASPEMTDQITGIDNPSGAWAVNRFSFSSIWALYQAQGYTPTGAVDLTNASSVTSGPLAWAASATLPGTPVDGQFTYYTGGAFDVMGFYNSDTWRYFVAFDSFPDTSGQVWTYDGAGGFAWSVPATGDVTADSATTFTNKTIDANGTGNSISNIEAADIAPTTLITSSETGGTLTDDQLITAKAAKDYADSLALSGSEPTVQATNKRAK